MIKQHNNLISLLLLILFITQPVLANNLEKQTPNKVGDSSICLLNKKKGLEPEEFYIQEVKNKRNHNYTHHRRNTNKSKMYTLNTDKKHTLKIKKQVKKLDTPIFKSEEEKMQYAFYAQKKLDIQDIKRLWESTVSKNSVIKFALKKLAMPAEKRRVHSSLMARTVSTLISGVAILPSMFGADSVSSTASLASGRIANNVLAKKTMPKHMPLTDTELIHLAGLVENLQNSLIKNYYDYKTALEELRLCRQKIVDLNERYSDALKSKDDFEIIAASALYDKEKLNELKYKQQVKMNRLKLERLAGLETVQKLNLTRLACFNPAEDIQPMNKEVK